MRGRRLGLAVICVAACGPSVAVDDGGTTGSSDDPDSNGVTMVTSAGTTPDPSTTVPGTSIATMSEGEADVDSGGVDTAGFSGVPDGGGVITGCSIWERDCPPGSKCMPYANDGAPAWNDTICTPVVRDPRQIGDACLAFEGPFAGFDDCDIHMMCWDVDPETNEGTCLGFCIGSEAEHSCAEPDAYCAITGFGLFALCMPSCHPLDEPCVDGEVCVADGAEFFCAPDASEDGGAVLDPCEFVNVCDPGLACGGAELVPGCEGATGCCTPFCDLTDGMACADGPPGSQCVPWYEVGTAPRGYENLGVCGVPP